MASCRRNSHHHHDDDDIEAATTSIADCSRCPELFPNLYFRSIQPADRQQVQALHEDWFPVVYQDDFYDALVYGRLSAAAQEYHDSSHGNSTCCHIEEGAVDNEEEERKDDLEKENHCTLPTKTPPRSKPLVTYVALEDKEKQGQGIRMCDPYTLTNGMNNGNQTLRNRSDPNIDDDYDDEHDISYPLQSQQQTQQQQSQTQSSSLQTTHNDRIVACVVGAFVEHTILSEELRTMLIPDTTQHTRLFYIMTLGTVTNYRRTGLASHLVQQCCRAAAAVPTCGTIYLHVLDTNEAAIRFYEKLGFYRVKLIPNYYSIHGRPRHCYLYAKYLNGACASLLFVSLFVE